MEYWALNDPMARGTTEVSDLAKQFTTCNILQDSIGAMYTARDMPNVWCERFILECVLHVIFSVMSQLAMQGSSVHITRLEEYI